MRRPVVIAALPLALALAGCGGTGINADADSSAGKGLFQQKCASCHELADAGSKAQVGPNLDAAFARAREDGMGESTVREVTRGQIEYALPPMPSRDELDLSDADADSIAAYVASVAGVKTPAGTGATPAPPPPAAGGGGAGGGGGTDEGKKIFATAGCVSCHTLADAGSTGTIGPNLDETKPSKELAVDRVTHGSGAMPPFKGQLSDAQIEGVAEYVSSVAGK